ncbi:MAG: hypothetical protein Q9160_000595 [Pyrenula sp. 1 TL-2023]
MQPPFPSPTPTWHNDTYAAISPQRAAVSQTGKTVIITGAGGVIGQSIAVAFAEAGASQLVLIGRTRDTLAATEARITTKNCQVRVHVADVNDEAAMAAVAQAVGSWDVFVMNAGYISAPSPIDQADLADYWQSYESNVRSIVVTAKTFLPTTTSPRPVLLGNTAGAIVFPPAMTAGLSAYLVSKLAQIKTLEYLATEKPSLFVASVQPGMIDSPIFRGSGASPDALPMDTATLPGHFMVWLASEEAAFLKGRFVFSNWDVEELKARAPEIEEKNLMTATCTGWPYTPF